MGEILRVLLLEDSESDAELVVRQLARGGYDVRARRVEDAAATRGALADAQWDLIVSDYRMPDFTAPEALKILQETGQDIPFLIVSGTIGEEVAVAMMKAGASDYLMKGHLTRLAATVDRELRDARLREERRQAIRTLEERESQLALAIEATEMGIFDHDPAAGKTYYSELCKRHLRVPQGAEPILADFLESLHPEDRDRVKNAVDRAFQPESGGRYAETYRLKATDDGEERWISAWGKVFHDEQGKPTRFLGVVRDISERKRAERDLQFQLQLTACITEQSTNCIVLTGRDGRVRFMNPEAERVFGFSFEELAGQCPHDLLHRHPAGFSADECPLSRQISSGELIRDSEDVVFHKDGTPIAVSVSCSPLELNGARVGVVTSFSDIRERKRAERALRTSDERFRALFNADVVGILITDGEHIQEANDHFLRILGYSRDEFFAVRKNWRDVTPPDGIDHSLQSFRQYWEQGTLAPFEKEYLRKDGSRVTVLLAAVELSGEPNREMLCFVVDQTERKSLEQQFRQAQKLESIGRLAGGVAHDFNNLLTVILGYSDMVRSGLDPEHPFREPLDQISGAATKASALTRQLLTFSRRNAFEPKIIPIDEVVSGVEKLVRRLIEAPIEVIVSLRAETGLIHADPGQVEQVIVNLAVNARDAMPDGGRLFIETARISVSAGFEADCLSVTPGNHIALTVTDTGTGMTPEVQARLFEPFFTTKEPGKGTGLGLSTVYGIVKQCGGSVSVHSAPGLGTSFRVLFPAVEDGWEPAEPIEAEIPLDGNETVLVVEDEPGVRNYVRDMLEAHGYRALDAARGEDAMEIARYYSGIIHLLLTDVVLPGMKGLEVIRQFQALRPGVPVLRMSGYPERFGISPNEDVYLIQKPFTPEALLTRIRRVLDAPCGAAATRE
jgi:PAS domain S-box-containing protein